METNLIALPALGLDIGRVVMCPADDDGRPDTSFLDLPDDQALEVPAAPFLWDVLPEIVSRFSGRVWLVSKAGARIESLTRRWLAHHRFFERAGMIDGAVRFCRRREEKRSHAISLRLTHFVDDRSDVLESLRGVVSHLYLFGAQREDVPGFATHTADWRAVRIALLADLEESGRDVLREPDSVRRAQE